MSKLQIIECNLSCKLVFFIKYHFLNTKSSNGENRIAILLLEEQAGFRKGRNTVNKVFNRRNLIDKHLNSQKNLFHNFIYFKKAFDRVYHDGLWSALHKFGFQHQIIIMIKALYDNPIG